MAEGDRPAGKQKNPSKKGVQFVTPQQCLDIMREMKRKGRAPYWQDLEPVIASKGKGPRQCYLQCIKEAGICGMLLSVTNPAERAKVQGFSMQGSETGRGAGFLDRISANVKAGEQPALERAQKMAYICTNSCSGSKGANEEMLLSVMDVLDEEEEDV